MILVVSYPGEEHTDAVAAKLQAAGRQVVRIDLSDYPARHGMALAWDGDPPRLVLDTSDGPADLAGCRAVWWRRVRPFGIDAGVLDSHARHFVASETQQAIGGALSSLTCAWMNPALEDEAAHRKPYQWSVAREVGLALPRTLVSTDPARVRAFLDGQGGRPVVFKAFLASEQAWRETRLVRPDDLARLDAVRLAPVIFQEYVEGVDLRVTIVGDRLFAAEIDATRTSYPVDMRMVVGEAAVRPVSLPAALEAALLALMRRLGLVYGAVDLRQRPDGTYLFLEVNPAGQWLFVEDRTGLPITAAVAALLQAMADSAAESAVSGPGTGGSS